MQIAIKRLGEPLEITDTTYKYRTDCIKSILESGADYVHLNNDGCFTLAVDETGLMKELPTNFLLQMENSYYPIQKMVGTAVFIRCKPLEYTGEEIYDYELTDITKEDIIFISHILNEEYQNRLKDSFNDYGKGKAFIMPLNSPPFWF